MYTYIIFDLHKSNFWHKAVKNVLQLCPQNESYLPGIPELGVVVSEGMRTILWDLDRNAGDMPFKFDCLLLFSVFSFCLLLKIRKVFLGGEGRIFSFLTL